jgi:energy-coupling factor transporter ATP-binding protein EcfA2
MTILLVEQNTRLALETAQRAYVLATGEIALSGSSAEPRHATMSASGLRTWAAASSEVVTVSYTPGRSMPGKAPAWQNFIFTVDPDPTSGDFWLRRIHMRYLAITCYGQHWGDSCRRPA